MRLFDAWWIVSTPMGFHLILLMYNSRYIIEKSIAILFIDNLVPFAVIGVRPTSIVDQCRTWMERRHDDRTFRIACGICVYVANMPVFACTRVSDRWTASARQQQQQQRISGEGAQYLIRIIVICIECLFGLHTIIFAKELYYNNWMDALCHLFIHYLDMQI